jgi:hypothetical protein
LIGSKSSGPAPHTGHSSGGFSVASSLSQPQTTHRHFVAAIGYGYFFLNKKLWIINKKVQG